MKKNLAVVLVLLAAGCSSGNPLDRTAAPPMDPSRSVSQQECDRPWDAKGGNLLCREINEAERRARIAEEARQARARKEAQERAERERLERERAEANARLERERAEALAREEAARKAREAEAERLAAERRRLEAEAARKAEEERQRKEKAEAEARAKREAEARECGRLEQERQEGRAVLEGFVANYSQVDEFKAIAGQIAAFLKQPRKVKPCPSA